MHAVQISQGLERDVRRDAVKEVPRESLLRVEDKKGEMGREEKREGRRSRRQAGPAAPQTNMNHNYTNKIIKDKDKTKKQDKGGEVGSSLSEFEGMYLRVT